MSAIRKWRVGELACQLRGTEIPDAGHALDALLVGAEGIPVAAGPARAPLTGRVEMLVLPVKGDEEHLAVLLPAGRPQPGGGAGGQRGGVAEVGAGRCRRQRGTGRRGGGGGAGAGGRRQDGSGPAEEGTGAPEQ